MNRHIDCPQGKTSRFHSIDPARQKTRFVAVLRIPYPLLVGICLVLFGCAGDEGDGTPRQEPPTGWAIRAQRVAYAGAPPVIPHTPFSAACTTCHTATGSVVPPRGLAPANPHLNTPGLSDKSRCRQCHVFSHTTETFVDSDFVGLRPSTPHGDKAHALAPPTIPHRMFMHENCLACHGGPAARPEIRCTHPERIRCVQCHVPAHSGAMSIADFDAEAQPVSTVDITTPD